MSSAVANSADTLWVVSEAHLFVSDKLMAEVTETLITGSGMP